MMSNVELERFRLEQRCQQIQKKIDLAYKEATNQETLINSCAPKGLRVTSVCADTYEEFEELFEYARKKINCSGNYSLELCKLRELFDLLPKPPDQENRLCLEFVKTGKNVSLSLAIVIREWHESTSVFNSPLVQSSSISKGYASYHEIGNCVII